MFVCAHYEINLLYLKPLSFIDKIISQHPKIAEKSFLSKLMCDIPTHHQCWRRISVFLEQIDSNIKWQDLKKIKKSMKTRHTDGALLFPFRKCIFSSSLFTLVGIHFSCYYIAFPVSLGISMSWLLLTHDLSFQLPASNSLIPGRFYNKFFWIWCSEISALAGRILKYENKIQFTNMLILGAYWYTY